MKKNDLVFLKPLQHIAQMQDNCCFRELLDLWYENDYCIVKPIIDIKSVGYSDSTLIPEARPWINSIGDILLYDQPIHDKLPPSWNFALFANDVLKKEHCSNWIFWPRFPTVYYCFVQNNGIRKYEDRNIRSSFIGNFTTNARDGEWSKFIEFFSMGTNRNHLKDLMKFSYEEYLKILSASKFGLCLRGVGPKCLRDVELMGLGIVPIFTPGVSVDYYDPIIKDKHFLYVEEPKDIPNVIENCTKDQWQYISNNCLEWFKRNSTIEGSFLTTLEILEKNKVI